MVTPCLFHQFRKGSYSHWSRRTLFFPPSIIQEVHFDQENSCEEQSSYTKPGLTQLQLLQFTIEGATWSKLLSLALGKTSELTKVSFFLPLVPIRGESKQYHRQFEGTKRVSEPVSLSQHDSPYWPWLCEPLLSTK